MTESTRRNDLRYLRAARREPVDRVPMWIMRQAGRYLPEYRELRKKHDFLTVCRTPELAAEVTLQPLRRFPLDAAILFSDIMVPIEAMGCPVEFTPAPKFEKPITTTEQVDALVIPEPREKLDYVLDAIRILRRELPEDTALIGFAGAPITLATYMVEGGSSKQFHGLRKLLYQAPAVGRRLVEKLTETVVEYLAAQIEAGADAVQVFDTWAGMFSPAEYERFAVPYLKRIVAAARQAGVPVTYYALGAGHLLEQISSFEPDVVGVDWRMPLSVAWKTLGPTFAVQGNLDPAALFAPPPEIVRRTKDVLDDAGNAPGHIFNLGHGILPDTPLESVEALVQAVHSHGKRGDAQ